MKKLILKPEKFIEDISFGSRLKELMKHNLGSNKPMTQSELKKKLDKLNNNKEVVSITTISNWVCGKVELTKNKAQILEYLAKIFKVDVAYLECTQLESFNILKLVDHYLSPGKNEKELEEEKKAKAVEKYLELLGITFTIIYDELETTKDEFMLIDKKVWKGNVKTVDIKSYKLSYKGKNKLLSYEEFEKFKDDIITYSFFLFNKLKD
jgi:transcriptional regulator with XRE-family HTH domain